MKRWNQYVQIRENKQRRKAIPESDKGQVFNGYHLTRRISNRLTMALRQSNLFIRHFIERKHMYGVLLFLLAVWLSGWFASAGDKFESLLILVVGFIFLAIVTRK